MDSYYDEYPSEAFMILQAGFNELIRNAYLQGFNDGQEFELKIREEVANRLDEEKVNNLESRLSPNQPSVLVEVEQLLQEYS